MSRRYLVEKSEKLKKGGKGGRKKVDGRFEETRDVDKFWNSRMKTKDESRLIIRLSWIRCLFIFKEKCKWKGNASRDSVGEQKEGVADLREFTRRNRK